jgi:predicted ferric reductase
MDALAKLVAGAKTPLALAGVVLYILYRILHQILALQGVFGRLNSAQTANFLTFVVQSMFWLAVLAICLGMIGWLLQLNPRYRPGVKAGPVEVIPPGTPSDRS